MAWLYSITHKESGKMYIGWCSIPVEKRWKIHLTNAVTTANYKSKFTNNYFYNAIRRCGKDKFSCDIIQYLATDDEAKQSEIYWISKLKEFGISLYNTTPGGDGTGSGIEHPGYGKPKPEAMKQKIRGENNPLAKLNYNSVIEIKRLIQEDFNDTEIGRMFGVARRTITDIRRNITWTHVP